MQKLYSTTARRKAGEGPAAAAQDCAGGADHVRLSNTALVTEGKIESHLLHFGLDWLVFYLGHPYSTRGRTLEFFDELFRELSENPLFSTINNQVWCETEYIVNLSFNKAKGDLFVYVYLNGKKVCAIRKITINSTMPSSVRSLYEYQVTVYGEFFATQQSGLVSFKKFWSTLLREIHGSSASHIVSTIHVCVDIENLTTLDVWNGVCIESPIHSKEVSQIRTDPQSGIPQTIYYGQKSDGRWLARIYNKIAEIHSSKKEGLYPQYWGKEAITRIELEFKRSVCKDYGITLENCTDNSFLLSLFQAHLQTKYVQWDVFAFIKESLTQDGLEAHSLEKIKPDYSKLTEEQRFKRITNQAIKHSEIYNVDVPYYLRLLADQIESATPEKIW